MTFRDRRDELLRTLVLRQAMLDLGDRRLGAVEIGFVHDHDVGYVQHHDLLQLQTRAVIRIHHEHGLINQLAPERKRFLTRADDSSHKQKAIYSLTEKGIELLPVLAQMSAWGLKHLPVTEELSIRAELLDEGGPKLWAEFMNELRETHLGVPQRRKPKRGVPVSRRLQAAYEAVVARKARG